MPPDRTIPSNEEPKKLKSTIGRNAPILFVSATRRTRYNALLGEQSLLPPPSVKTSRKGNPREIIPRSPRSRNSLRTTSNPSLNRLF